MKTFNTINTTDLFTGILIVVITVIFLFYQLKQIQKNKEGRFFSLDVRIIGSSLVLIVIGVFMIYRELSKILLILTLFILMPSFGVAQNKSCDELKKGVFEVIENSKKVGVIYRKNGYQLEDYLNGKKIKIVRFREKKCQFYFNSLEIENELDTVTMFVTYKKSKKGIFSFLAKPIYHDIDYEYQGIMKKISNDIDSNLIPVFDELEMKSKFKTKN